MTFSGRTRVVVMTEPRAGALDLVERPLPALKSGEALVRIRNAGICGTDLHIIGWNEWAARAYTPPFAMGHEFCGEIVDLKDGAPFAIGDRVTGETHLSCGHCDQCRMGRGHTCDNLRTFSRLDSGAFADYSVVPVKLLRKVPGGISDRVGAIMEPLGIAVRCAREAGSEGNHMLVSGCGPIGLMAIATARHLGAARIIASDPSPERRQLALRLGANVTVDPVHEPLEGICKDTTRAGGVDVTIETSGVSSAIDTGLKSIRRGGAMVMAGLPAKAVPIDVTSHIVLREIVLRGIYGRILDQTWLDTERALLSGLDVDPVITEIFDLADYQQAIACATASRSGKVLLSLNA